MSCCGKRSATSGRSRSTSGTTASNATRNSAPPPEAFDLQMGLQHRFPDGCYAAALRFLLSIVEEIGRTGKAAIARSVVRAVIRRSRRRGGPSRAARIVKSIRLAGAPYAADCGHTLLQRLETAVG